MDEPFSEWIFTFWDGTDYQPINVWYNPDPDVWNHCIDDCTAIQQYDETTKEYMSHIFMDPEWQWDITEDN